jgi:uncharacterized membrane protein
MRALTSRRAVIAIVIGCIASLIVYPDLRGPYLFARISPEVTRLFIAFALPLAAAVTYLILRSLWSDITAESDRDPEEAADVVHRAIAERTVFFMMAIHMLLMLNLRGISWVRSWGPRLVVVLFGCLFIAIGDLLPRSRPNLAVGIRTRRTLADRRFWIRLHRTSGYVAVSLGVFITICGLLLTGHEVGVFVGAAALTSIVSLAVAYWRQTRA